MTECRHIMVLQSLTGMLQCAGQEQLQAGGSSTSGSADEVCAGSDMEGRRASLLQHSLPCIVAFHQSIQNPVSHAAALLLA